MTMRWGHVVGYDADAQAWYHAVEAGGGTIGAAAKRAYSDHIARGKANGWGAHILFEMPFIGNFTAACKARAVGLGTLSPTINNFVSGDYSEATGLTGNGSTKFINLGFAPPAPTGGHSIYERAFAAAAYRSLGSRDGSHTCTIRRTATNSQNAYGALASVNTASVAPGHYHTRRESATSLKTWCNGAQLGTTNATSVTPAPVLHSYAFCENSSGSANNFLAASVPVSYLSYDDGLMSDAEATSFNASVETLQDAFGRGVV